MRQFEDRHYFTVNNKLCVWLFIRIKKRFYSAGENEMKIPRCYPILKFPFMENHKIILKHVMVNCGCIFSPS